MNSSYSAILMNQLAYVNKDNLYAMMKQSKINSSDEVKASSDTNFSQLLNEEKAKVTPVNASSFNPNGSGSMQSLTMMILNSQLDLKKKEYIFS